MPSIAAARIRPEIRYAWRGPSVLILDNEGRSGTDPLTGFFFRETRYLHNLKLTLNGEAPFLCSVAEASPNELEFSYIYPPVEGAGGGGSGSGGSGRLGGILFRGLDLSLLYRVRPASVEATLEITSRWDEGVEFELGWELGADYAALSEAHFGERQQEAPVEAASAHKGVRFRYQHPELPLETYVTIEGDGRWEFRDGRLTARITLGRQQTRRFCLRIRAVDSADPIDANAEERREERLQQWYADGSARLEAPGEVALVEITNRALNDLGSLALLEGETDEWLTPAAGMPLYPALFGRDALTVGWQAAALDGGQLIRDTLNRLVRLQGTRIDPERDEEPGRIIQQARRDPLSRLGRTPFDRYYGDVASPFMFPISLAQYFAWTGDRALLDRLWEPACEVLEWARVHGDRDGDGYIEYLTRSPQGPKHQGWKDSDNAVVYSGGTQVEPPIATCEVQGYYFAALQFMAVLGVVKGERKRAREFWRQAKRLREQFNRDFWLEDEGFVALGLDADKRPIRAITSNGGQALPTGIINDEHIPRLVERLFQPDLFSGWGIRTLSTRNPAYNPLSYHLGSVWPVENGTIMFGLRRYGFDDRALELARGMYDLARLWPLGRIPECVGGYARGERAHPGAYPRANVPQAWNQSMFPILIQAILGLRPVASLGLLALDPVLPPWLPELTIRKLRVGEARVTLRFHRDKDGDSHWETVEQEGKLRIVQQPPIDSLSAGVWDRLGALAKGVLPF